MLKGSALSAIARIPFTSENYSLVVKLFQERFGQKEAIVESYFKLQNLPKTGNKLADIQRVSETIETQRECSIDTSSPLPVVNLVESS